MTTSETYSTNEAVIGRIFDTVLDQFFDHDGFMECIEELALLKNDSGLEIALDGDMDDAAYDIMLRLKRQVLVNDLAPDLVATLMRRILNWKG